VVGCRVSGPPGGGVAFSNFAPCPPQRCLGQFQGKARPPGLLRSHCLRKGGKMPKRKDPGSQEFRKPLSAVSVGVLMFDALAPPFGASSHPWRSRRCAVADPSGCRAAVDIDGWMVLQKELTPDCHASCLGWVHYPKYLRTEPFSKGEVDAVSAAQSIP